MQTSLSIRITASLFAGIALLGAVPARATDTLDAANTGVLAWLGLSAASGKNTLNAGAGELEAEFLAVPTLERLAGEIATTTKPILPVGSTVVILMGDEKLDLAAQRILQARLDDFTARIGTCAQLVDQGPGGAPTPLASDIVGAILTDRTIAPVKLEPSDYAIANAVAGALLGIGVHPRLPSEIIAPDTSRLSRQLNALDAAAKAVAVCKSASVGQQAAVKSWSDFKTALNERPKDGGNTPLEMLAQYYDLAVSRPKVLRLHLEKAAGSAVTRANIWYALGFPGAITIASGLAVTLRLIDSGTGELLAGGMSGCATKPVNFSHALAVKPEVVCKSVASVKG